MKLVPESLNESMSINESTVVGHIRIGDYSHLKEQYPIFGSKLTALIANEIQRAPKEVKTTDGKIDLQKFYLLMKKLYGKITISLSLDDFKERVKEMAIYLDFIDNIKLPRKEKSECKLIQYVSKNLRSLDYWENNEIDAEDALPTDRVIRSADESTQVAYYRVTEKLTEHESNMMKVAYAYKYGAPDKTPWKNYLDARPIFLKNIKGDEHLRGTYSSERRVGNFVGKEYN